MGGISICDFLFGCQIKLQMLLSTGDAERAASVAMAATQRHSQSVSVWSLSLQTLMQLGSGDMGRLFQEALALVNPKVHRPITRRLTS